MSLSEEGAEPTVAFVVATLNEADHIAACLRSLLEQEYPAARIEVAVVDGGSQDDTVHIAKAIATTDLRIKVLSNPRRIAAAAFNIGTSATSASIVSLVSAHSVVDPHYAKNLVRAFATSGAALVGGRMVAVADPGDVTAEAIRRATSSPVGLGNAAFHFSDKAQWVDTAFPGAYRRTLLEELGGFDEDLLRNQDDDLHYRASQMGHRMWFDPSLRSEYRPRDRFGALWRQYYEYGVWRSVTVRKHRRFAAARHAAPPAFVAGVAGGALLSPFGWARRVWVACLIAYAALLVMVAVVEKASAAVRFRLPVAVAVLHLAYGVGFWAGLLRRRQVG